MKKIPSTPKNFLEFMDRVEKELLLLCGMTSDCLPDWLYRDSWENNISPEQTAKAAIRNAREY